MLPRSWASYKRLVAAAREQRPDVLVLIDYPDFNFRLMRAVKALGIPIVYYISPQLWAWRPGRMKTMKALVDCVLPIFPFEEALYRREGVDVRFVGHPLLELADADAAARGHACARVRARPARPVVALLPGSRPNELTRLAPVLAAAAPVIAARVPGVQFIVARAPHLDAIALQRLRQPRPHAAHRRRAAPMTCCSVERCRADRVRHGDGADRDARQADGGALQAVADDLSRSASRSSRSTCTRWST